MLRSICARSIVRAGAAVAVFVTAHLPASSAEPAAPRMTPVVVASRAKTRIAKVGDADVIQAAGDSTTPSRPLAARRGARGILRTDFQNQPVSRPTSDQDSDVQAFVKPFRKIAEIVPYDSYDPLSIADDRERYPSNLCPCPEGTDCRESCPPEEPLRRAGLAKSEPDRSFVPRSFAHIHYCWEPTNLYHNPIYFEDFPLERYGHTRHYLIQPVFSGVKFATQLLGLPYQMSLYPCCSKQYSLGYYRPGECAPAKYYQIPLNAQAALVEAGVISGGYFLFAPGIGP
jgi:hypothetical protein